MSSNFWALSAAKKKTEFVPGTSKWVANELSTINDVILDHNDKIYRSLQQSYGHMNSFMFSVLQGIDDKLFVKEIMATNSILIDQTSPSNFTYIAPDLPSSVRASPTIERKEPLSQFKPTSPERIPTQLNSPELPHVTNIQKVNEQPDDKLAQQHKTSTPKKSTSPIIIDGPVESTSPIVNGPKESTSPVITNASPVSSPVFESKRYIPQTPSPLKDSKVTESKEDEKAPEADDSFQAISTAIRKSIAGKILGTSGSSNTPSSPPREKAMEQEKSTRVSMKDRLPRKSLLSKTPKRSSIFVSLPSKEPIPVSSSGTNSRIRSRSLRVFDRLDIASRHETASNANNFSLSPVSIPKETLRLATSLKLDKPVTTQSNSKSSNFHQKGLTESIKPLNSLQALKIPSLAKEDQKEDGNVKQPPKDQRRVSPKKTKPPIPINPARSPVRNVPSTRTPVTRSPITKLPSKSPATKIPSARSRSVSPKRDTKFRSPTLASRISRSGSPESRGSGNDLELISRLMAPTSSSAAKSNTPYKIQKLGKDKKPEPNYTKNRFLTTTLIPTIPKFNPQKPPQFNNVPNHVKAHHSPIKRRAPVEEEKPTEPLQIPTLKKKSMMAERSEAAAQKPKQRIMLAMNHKLELKLNPKPEFTRRQKTEGAIVSPKSKLTGQPTRDEARHNNGNSVPLPEAARGNLKPDSKRQKDTSPKQKKVLGKKASRISGMDRRSTTDPQTPAKLYTPDNLPDIHTDDEDSGRNEKILQSWGHTPELHRIIMQNKNINPTSVFGEVPKLNIEDIFESQSSRQRGRQSPQISPDEKQRQREENQYAIQMGYK